MKKTSILALAFLPAFYACQNKTSLEAQQVADVDSAATVIPDTASAEGPKVTITEAWASDSILKTPESVLFDPNSNTLFVSNVEGNPTDKDNKGFISKLSPDGKIVNLKWATGLNAPKGMGLLGGKLYVTDIDKLAEIDTKTGKITKTWKVPNAKFLNDIAEDTATKTIYFTDMDDNKIYTLKDGQVAVWLDKGLSGPNGLFVKDGNLYLASNKDNTFKSIDLKTKEVKVLANEIGAGDGVEYTGSGDKFIVSDWQGEVFLIDGGNKTSILNTKDKKINSADIEYIQEQNLLLVPTFFNNRVVAYKIAM